MKVVNLMFIYTTGSTSRNAMVVGENLNFNDTLRNEELSLMTTLTEASSEYIKDLYIADGNKKIIKEATATFFNTMKSNFNKFKAKLMAFISKMLSTIRNYVKRALNVRTVDKISSYIKNSEVDSKLSNIDLKLNPNKVYKTYAGFLNFINNPKASQVFISMDNAINKYTNETMYINNDTNAEIDTFFKLTQDNFTSDQIPGSELTWEKIKTMHIGLVNLNMSLKNFDSNFHDYLINSLDRAVAKATNEDNQYGKEQYDILMQIAVRISNTCRLVWATSTEFITDAIKTFNEVVAHVETFLATQNMEKGDI